MRSLAAISLGTLLLAGAPRAHQTLAEGPCLAPQGPSIERLQALARRYHPDALARANGEAFVLVAFIFDAKCRVIHHATGRRAGDEIDLEATLTSLFPALGPGPFLPAGMAQATAKEGPGSPWIVWAVMKS